MENLVEGYLEEGKNVVVVEDLISTGGSSLKAVAALREEKKANVLGMVAIFTYGFPVAEEAFKQAGVELTTLSNYEALIKYAVETGYVGQEEVKTLQEWRKNPSQWQG